MKTKTRRDQTTPSVVVFEVRPSGDKKGYVLAEAKHVRGLRTSSAAASAPEWAAVAKMLRLHTGRIIFVSSVGAFIGLPGQANYAASKAGLVGMARAIAREVGSRQITVTEADVQRLGG